MAAKIDSFLIDMVRDHISMSLPADKVGGPDKLKELLTTAEQQFTEYMGKLRRTPGADDALAYAFKFADKFVETAQNTPFIDAEVNAARHAARLASRKAEYAKREAAARRNKVAEEGGHASSGVYFESVGSTQLLGTIGGFIGITAATGFIFSAIAAKRINEHGETIHDWGGTARNLSYAGLALLATLGVQHWAAGASQTK